MRSAVSVRTLLPAPLKSWQHRDAPVGEDPCDLPQLWSQSADEREAEEGRDRRVSPRQRAKSPEARLT